MAGIKEVAAHAGVSVATVSRVLNDNANVSDEARTKVLSAVETLRYRPNTVARSLRTEATRTLGLIVGDIVNPFFGVLARAAEDEARAAGYTVVIGNADERPERQDRYVRTLLERPITAIAQPAEDLGRRAVRALLQRIGDRPVESVVLPAHLVIRRSCGEPLEEQ